MYLWALGTAQCRTVDNRLR